MKKIINALNRDIFNPLELINSLKEINSFRVSYETKVRHYTLERHTFLVLSEYEKYFSIHNRPNIDKSVFRLLLAIHDIGKPLANNIGNRHQQYEFTADLLNKHRKELPLSLANFNLIKNIVTFDPIGLFLQNQLDLHSTVSQIEKRAKQSNFQRQDFFDILCVYYQSDVASYTKDAGGFAFLERLFTYKNNEKIYDKADGLLKFSPKIEIDFLKLKRFFK